MEIGVSALASDVRRLMDEIGVNDSQNVLGADDSEIGTIIEGHIVPAAEFVVGQADWSLLEADAEEDNTPPASGQGNIPQFDDPGLQHQFGTSGPYWWEVIPTDFFRLVSARLDDWTRAVSDVVWNTEKAYAKLKNQYTTGTPERPVVAARKAASGEGCTLELYSTRQPNGTYHVSYCRRPKINNQNKIVISSKLEHALRYYVAGLTLLTLRDEHADSFMNLAMVNMGIKTKE